MDIDCYLIEAARHLLRISWSSKTYFVKILLIYRFSHMLFEKQSGSNNRLTHHSRSGKHGRLGHVIGTRGMSRGRSLRSINFIWFSITWVTEENSSKCVFVLISMLGRVKDSHYSSCSVIILFAQYTSSLIVKWVLLIYLFVCFMPQDTCWWQPHGLSPQMEWQR